MEDVPARVREYADQAVEYVRRALGVTLEYDSNTLPLLDHYLRDVPQGEMQTAALQLVILTSGAYFGEVVRRRLGGRWDMSGETEAQWRVVLPTGLNFSPLGFVASAITHSEGEDIDASIDAPQRMRPYLQQALQRMGEVSEQDYYSLCGRLDTLEHLHEVLVAVAAQMMGNAVDPDDDVAPEPVSDEPSGGIN
jgi:hypothetical protein